MKDINLNQLKLKVGDIYEKDEKITTNCEASNPEDVINTGFLDKNFFKREGHISETEDDSTEFKILIKKQFVEEVPIQRAVKTSIQKLLD